MTKESFFIHVQGAPFGTPSGQKEIFRGEHTHMRSEGSWMLSIALNMARHGHPVTILAYQWGNQSEYPLPKNITLQKEFIGECDVFMDVGWDDMYAVQRYKSIKAKHYIHGWAGDPYGSTFPEYIKKHNLRNHYLARTSRCFRQYFDKFPYSIYAPTALADKIREPNLDSRKMLWANRGAFHPNYANQSEEVLEFMERHPDYEYTVLLYGDIVERATKEIKKPDIVKRFEKLPNAHLIEPYWGIPHNEFLDELSKSKILLANGNPSAHPQTIEAVCMGCMPLLWSFAEHHFQASDYHVIPADFNLDGTKNVDNILEDKELHKRYFQALKDVSLDYEYDNAYNILMNEIFNKEY